MAMLDKDWTGMGIVPMSKVTEAWEDSRSFTLTWALWVTCCAANGRRLSFWLGTKKNFEILLP
jgi:hypothetical protein